MTDIELSQILSRLINQAECAQAMLDAGQIVHTSYQCPLGAPEGQFKIGDFEIRYLPLTGKKQNP